VSKDGAVCSGTGRFFVARARYFGYQKYEVLSRHRTKNAAVMAMAKAFNSGRYKRADVLLCADYYDPYQVCELVTS
jgi:hypothetical protein